MKKTFLTHPRTYYTDLLRDNVCVVVFEKVDGTERTLIGTTKGELIPSTHTPSPGYISPDHQIRLFDVQNQAWRSFTTTNVISFDVVDNNK